MKTTGEETRMETTREETRAQATGTESCLEAAYEGTRAQAAGEETRMGATRGGNEEEELYHMMRLCGHILNTSGSSKTGQGRILHILDRQGAVSQKDLQTMLGVASGSISEILTKLEKAGFIARRRDESDRRKVIIVMTKQGKEHARAYRDGSQEKDWFSALDASQRAELKELLGILLHSWHSLD